MLDSVIGAFLDSVESERDLDGPLLAILRAQGWTSVHLIHGAFEFGKDAIGQRSLDGSPTQYVFQSKRGDLSLAGWRSIAGQIDELRRNTLAHPGFDSTLPRVGVLVLSGRLTGGAPLAIQEYVKDLRTRGEIPLEVWDRERLIEIFKASPGCLIEADVGPLLALLGSVDGGMVTESAVEMFSRRWVLHGAPVWRSVLEAVLLAQRLASADRADLACYTMLCLVRGVWASVYGADPPDSEALDQADLAGNLFVQYATALLGEDRDVLLDPVSLIGGQGVLATYAVRCLRTAEVAGLLGLHPSADEAQGALADWLARFVSSQAGAAHPISDRWAVSLVPVAVMLALRQDHRHVLETHLKEVLRWLGDLYDDDGLGLADAEADPETEVAYLLGGAFEHVEHERRSTSLLAAVLHDVASSLELGRLYDDIRNDTEAVGAHPAVPLPADAADQNLLGSALRVAMSPGYVDDWTRRDGWKTAPHQTDDSAAFYLGRIERPWDQLAISAVLRDRYWLWPVRSILDR